MVPDEKELKKKIKNSLKSGISESEITRRLQTKKLKLEYIHTLMKKARPHSKFFYISASLIIFLVVIAGIFAYLLFFQQGTKQNLTNPLMAGNYDSTQQISIDQIQVTPDFISYLLNEIGAYELHKNPITFEKPIINFDVSGQKFSSLITKSKIETSETSSQKADLEFITSKEILITAMMNQNPAEVFKQSLQQGQTKIITLDNKWEYHAKDLEVISESR